MAWVRVEAVEVVKSDWILNIIITSYIACHFLVTLLSNFLTLYFSICFNN